MTACEIIASHYLIYNSNNISAFEQQFFALFILVVHILVNDTNTRVMPPANNGVS